MAHLFAGESAYRDLDLDVVTFVPAGAPWQKADRNVSAATHRWEMTRLAVEGVPYFVADDREVLRDGWTYTVDTLREFPGDELTLILGSDAAAGIPSWHEPDEILRRATVAVVPRPGASRSAVAAALPGGFRWLDGPELDISGTMLRARASAGSSIRFLVPEPVAAYIEDHGVYRPGADPASP
jgi:nicotinate-nucleotide adenylyltransferase